MKGVTNGKAKILFIGHASILYIFELRKRGLKKRANVKKIHKIIVDFGFIFSIRETSKNFNLHHKHYLVRKKSIIKQGRMGNKIVCATVMSLCSTLWIKITLRYILARRAGNGPSDISSDSESQFAVQRIQEQDKYCTISH